jgi:hypothetical protein
MAQTSQSDLYGEEYYRTGCTRGEGPPYRKGEPVWEAFFARVADEIVLSLKPRTVFDAGCAIGFLVEALWDRGVAAHGRDISEFAIEQVRPDVKSYCEIGSVTDPIDGRYDLITCIEILEHLPEADGIAAIDALTQASDQILFSSSPDDFDEPTHINVRPPIYWSRLFAQRSFGPVIGYDASFIAPHAVLFIRSDEAPSDDVLLGHAELVRVRLELSTAREKQHRAEQKQLEAEHKQLDAEQKQLGAEQKQFEAERKQLQAEHLLAETKLKLEADLDAAQTALREARESFEAERRASELKLQSLDERSRCAEEALKAMAASTSWRLTAPARQFGANLRRLRQAFVRPR